MSDQDVSKAFDALEDLLTGTADHPDPVAIADWHAAFRQSLATAEQGPQWPALQARGQALNTKLNEQVAFLKALQHSIQQELASQPSALRALSAYAPPRN